LHRTRTIFYDLLLTAAAVLVVAAPLLFTRSGFAADFTNHLWLTWVEGEALAQAGHPSYFFNASGSGVFYPFFAFYGGTLYVVTGAISNLLGGHAEVAFVCVTTLAIIGSYTGALWLGRQFGLRGWTAHAPALAVITSAYYITNLYGRGAWTELMATSAIAPLIASGVHLVRTRRWRPWPVLAFVLSMVIFTGSHNITLLWGSTMVTCALLVMWLVLGAPRRLPYRRLAMVAGLGVASVLVNAWYLFPDIAYAGDVVAHNISSAPIWAGTGFFNTPGVLLDPLRHMPSQSTSPAIYVQAPDWFLAWGLVTGALLLWRRPVASGLRRAWVGAVIFVLLVLGMITVKPFWDLVSFPFNEIQFPYRLGSYLFYAVAGLVLVGALALQRASVGDPRRAARGLRLALVAVSAVSLGLCVWQLWVPSSLWPIYSYTNRGEALASVNTPPRSWYDHGSYFDDQAPVVTVPGERLLLIDPSQVHGDRFAAWMNAPPGPEPIQTNISGGPYLVHISGLRRVGRNPHGYTVVRRVNGGNGPVHVVVETTHSLLIELGRALSILAILAILAVLASTGVLARRDRRTTHTDPHADLDPTRRREPAGAALG
jgi:hypothetical protein